MNQTSTIIKALCLLLFPAALWGQTAGDYRSAGTGNWNNTATWERYDGASWITPAPSTPTSADGAITIRNTHTVTISASVTADQITVDAGGALNNNTGTALLTINDGAGTDLTVNGIFTFGGINTLTPLGASPSVLINGTMSWTSGTLQVPTTIAATGILNMSNNNFAKGVYTTLTNNGTINWATGTTAGGFSTGNGASIVNNGTINEQFESDRGVASGVSAPATFINNGVINKTTTFKLQFFSPITFTNTGTIKGIGTVQCDVNPSNSGIIAPGNSPGILNVSTNLVQGQPTTIQLEVVDGSGAGTGHDQLRFTTNVNLTGVTINIQDFTVSPPAPVQNYTILTTSVGFSFSGTPTFVSGSNYSLITPISGTSVQVSKNTSFPLPAVWGSFSALARNNQVRLKWETLQESNVADYTVEYSVNGRDYLPLGTVAAVGNSSSVQTYNFVHTMPDLAKNNFYRIRQTDLDGKFAFSEIRSAKFSNGQVVAVTATPNPVRDRLQLQVQAENIRVVLTDLAGRTIQSLQTQPGYHELNMSKLAPGLYNLSVFSNNSLLETQKIVKQ